VAVLETFAEPVKVVHAAMLMLISHAVLVAEAQLNAMAAAQEIIQIVAVKDGRILAVAAEIAALSKDIVMHVIGQVVISVLEKVFAVLQQHDVKIIDIKLAQAAAAMVTLEQMQIVIVLINNVKMQHAIMQQVFAILQFQKNA
tara:strand:- start:377 stop:805 length:429 start_codon:yes stop_codon:yes gene_type:complete